MNEEILLTFIAVAYAGSFSKAAKERSYSVPTIMSQINELEGHLGTALFRRTNRGVTLTEAGKRFLPQIEDIIGKLNRAVQTIRLDTPHQTPLHIRIGTTLLLPVSLLGARFFQYLKNRQNVTFEIVPLEDPVIINEETNPFDRVDLIGYPLDTEMLFDHYTVYTLSYERICISVPFTHAFSERDAISLKDLNHQTICCRNTQYSDGTKNLIKLIHQ
ncbi:MAG: LysR family transcriptional regulator [Bulleidia sp.]